MRLIDADKLYAVLDNIADHLFEKKSEPQNSMAQTIQYVMGIVSDQHDIIYPPNDPLTLEDLREMDGEPVFVREIKNSDRHRWAFVDAGCEVVRYFTTRNGVAFHVIGNYFKTYGKTWLAYRRKPEDERRKT